MLHTLPLFLGSASIFQVRVYNEQVLVSVSSIHAKIFYKLQEVEQLHQLKTHLISQI
jgi:hypothetical protein